MMKIKYAHIYVKHIGIHFPGPCTIICYMKFDGNQMSPVNVLSDFHSVILRIRQDWQLRIHQLAPYS